MVKNMQLHSNVFRLRSRNRQGWQSFYLFSWFTGRISLTQDLAILEPSVLFSRCLQRRTKCNEYVLVVAKCHSFADLIENLLIYALNHSKHLQYKNISHTHSQIAD